MVACSDQPGGHCLCLDPRRSRQRPSRITGMRSPRRVPSRYQLAEQTLSAQLCDIAGHGPRGSSGPCRHRPGAGVPTPGAFVSPLTARTAGRSRAFRAQLEPYAARLVLETRHAEPAMVDAIRRPITAFRRQRPRRHFHDRERGHGFHASNLSSASTRCCGSTGQLQVHPSIDPLTKCTSPIWRRDRVPTLRCRCRRGRKRDRLESLVRGTSSGRQAAPRDDGEREADEGARHARSRACRQLPAW